MHSQNLEEKYILDYFGDRTGTFLSIGENDGVTLSNVRALALKDWRGVMVEPSPRAYRQLKNLYEDQKGFYTYPFALSSKNGKAILEESGNLLTGEDVGLVSTFFPHEKARFEKTVRYNPVEVKTFKWKTFLNRLTIKEFNMISIDVEGSEMDILPDMDLTATELICIEHNGSTEKKKQYLECTSKYGIDKLIYESGENVILAR